MPKYHLPPNTHSVSVGIYHPATGEPHTLEFVADEHGHIDLTAQPPLVVRQLVELAGCKPVRDDHPPVPLEPAAPMPAAPEPPAAEPDRDDAPDTSDEDTAPDDAAPGEPAPAAAVPVDMPVDAPVDMPLRLDPAKRSITPPRRAKAS